MLIAFVLDVALILAIAAFGGMLVRILLGRASLPLIFASAFPIGVGILTWISFVFSWLGIDITRTTVIVLLAVALNTVVARSAIRSKRPDASSPREAAGTPAKLSRFATIITALLAGLLLYAMLVAVLRSYSTWDAMAIWAAKGYGMALEGSVEAAQQWGALRLSYPLNMPILISYFKLISGDLLPGSKLVFPLFGLSLMLSCYSYWRLREVEDGIARASVLFLFSAPIIFANMTIGYVNLPFTAYLIGGFVIVIDGIHRGSGSHQLVGGILLALACWTRVEGVIYVAAIVLGIWLVYRAGSYGKLRAAPVLVPVGIIAVSWFPFSLARGTASQSHLSTAAMTALEHMADLELNLSALAQIGRHLVRSSLDPAVWAVTFVLSALILAWRWRSVVRERDPAYLAAVTAAGVLLVAVVAIFYLSSFRENPSLIDFLFMAFNRAMFPVVFLLVMAAFSLLAGEDSMLKGKKVAAIS
jgi:hypothetical protein